MSSDEPFATRRRFLGAVGTAGLAGSAGCLGSASMTGPSTAGREDGRDSDTAGTVSILAAGSLQHALETAFADAVDVPVTVESHGSATIARLVAEGHRDPDIVTVADTALFESPLSPPWHATFASNAVVLAYNPETAGGRRIANAAPDRWYEPLVDGAVRLGRTDPDQDPLGYRTLFTLELATSHYRAAPDLRRAILDRNQLYPETALISQFETGAIDAAVAYRSMAVERGYDYVSLPDEVNLSSPVFADSYATVSYTLPGGHEVTGGVIGYGSTIRRMNDAVRRVFAVHTAGDYLDDAGFILSEEFPRYEGSVPESVRRTADALVDKETLQDE